MNRPDYACSPCNGCTRTKEPDKCENKRCNPWRQWFLASWERRRRYPWAEMEARRAAALTEDPCKQCAKAEKICLRPCIDRGIWERKWQEG